MDFMKQYGVAILSLLMSAVLLFVLWRQNEQLDRLESDLQRLEQQLHEVEYAVQDIPGRLTQAMEAAEQPVQDWELRPSGINQTERTLEADVVLRLKEWSEETTVELTAVVGQYTYTTVLPINGAGLCTGRIDIPISERCPVSLDVVVTSGGVKALQDLGSWEDISMLLPVQTRSWGGTTPRFTEGMLVIQNYSADFENMDDEPASVQDLSYRLYVNDRLVQEGEECRDWKVACKPGDVYRLTAFCRDEYGLGYEFPLNEERIGAAGAMETIPWEAGERYPVLTWDGE